MFWKKSSGAKLGLDKELDELENAEAGSMLRLMSSQIAPNAAFEQQLEERLRQSGSLPQIVPEAVTEPRIQESNRRSGQRSVVVPRTRVGFGLPVAGIGVAAAMVMLLGLSMFYGSARDGLSSVPVATSTIPQPVFPKGVGESIILANWVSNWDIGKSGWEVSPSDPATGKAVPGYKPFVISRNKEQMGQIQLSPNGTRLVAIEGRNPVSWPSGGGVSTSRSTDVLHLIDVQAWREVTTTLSSNQAVGQLAFSADGKRLGINLEKYQYNPNRLGEELVVVGAATGNILARREVDIRPSRLEFSLDGSRLIVYGQQVGSAPGMDKPGPLRVMMLDSSTLNTVWEQTLDGIIAGYWCESNCSADYSQRVFASWNPAVTFSPDRSKMYIVHADAEKMTIVDFFAQQVRSVDIAQAKSWLEALFELTASKAEAKESVNGISKFAVLSADATQLYVGGQEMEAKRDPTAKSLGLRVVDIKSGRKVATIESDLGGLRVYYEGNQIFLSGLRDSEQVTDVLDAATLKRVNTIETWRVMPLRRLNGQPIILATQRVGNETQYGLMDPQTFKVTSTWPAPGSNMSLVARGDR